MRYKLMIEYDGAPFVGWQRQANGLSVQEVLEAALEAFCGQQVAVGAAGRTDAGVHALGQVVHFDLDKPYETDTVRDALNFHLKPHPVSVLKAETAAQDFHARFDALQRHYLYRILDRRPPPALDRGRVWHVPVRLDADRMQDAAQHLVGRHDFTTFRAAQCQAKSPLKTLDSFSVRRVGEEIHVTVSARSFLHHQVRSMVGTLKRVGEGKWQTHHVIGALRARDRAACGPVAPAHGLYLLRVDYSA